MKALKAAALTVALFGQLAAYPASAQRYEDDSPIGTTTNDEVRALASAFCQDNDFTQFGYSSQSQCEEDVFNNLHPQSNSGAQYETINLTFGGMICHYYGSPGRLGAGSC